MADKADSVVQKVDDHIKVWRVLAHHITHFVLNSKVINSSNEVTNPVSSWGEEDVDVVDCLLEVGREDCHPDLDDKADEEHRELDNLSDGLRISCHGAGETVCCRSGDT